MKITLFIIISLFFFNKLCAQMSSKQVKEILNLKMEVPVEKNGYIVSHVLYRNFTTILRDDLYISDFLKTISSFKLYISAHYKNIKIESDDYLSLSEVLKIMTDQMSVNVIISTISIQKNVFCNWGVQKLDNSKQGDRK